MPASVASGEQRSRNVVPASTAPDTLIWFAELRAQALKVYEREPLPNWRRSGFWTTSLRKLDLDALAPREHEPVSELPALVTGALGEQEVGALIVQSGASTVCTSVHPELAEQGVIVCPLDVAVQEHPELVREYYMRRISPDEGKFSAATAAFWTGGAFVHVPANVQVDKPIQSVYLIEEGAPPSTCTRSRSWASRANAPSASTAWGLPSRARRCTPADSSCTPVRGPT